MGAIGRDAGRSAVGVAGLHKPSRGQTNTGMRTQGRSILLHCHHSAGAGGDEAGIWAGDLLRMYQRYAQSQVC